MRYIYIICLLMSSFFAYKNSSAIESAIQYAFFVPQNVFQENVKVKDINNMKPRYEKKELPRETLSKNSGEVKKVDKPKITLPYVRKEVTFGDNVTLKENKETKTVEAPKAQPEKPTQSKPVQQQVTNEPPVAPEPPAISEEIKKKLTKYVLDDSFGDEDEKIAEEINTKELLKKDITKRLATIPYANRSLPKFQQTYSDYGSDLRVLFHRGKFPTNQKQENVLSKANSFRRFEVK